MIIAVPFFGKDPRFLKLLEHWFDLHAQSGTRIPAVVITDENELAGYPVLRVDTFALRSAMRGHPFDRKGAIVSAASLVLGRFLACDLDAFIQADPEPWLARMEDVPLATVADPWTREIIMHWDNRAVVKQRNAGVMWFGDVKTRMELQAEYLRQFQQMGADFADDAWREQLAWSAVAWRTGLHELPKELNWSHVQAGKEAAAIVHEHGETKWRRIA